jgi:hypothetical protein
MTQLPSSAVGMLRLMPSKVSEVASFVKQIVTSVKSGEANPLEVLVMLRAMEAAAAEIREEIEENIVREADKYAEKKFERYGAILEKSEVATKYNYATSKDTVYERLQTDFDTAKSRLDERTAFLKGLKQPMTIVDELTGEVVTINPPLKTSKSGVRVYIK